jgi:hypothetical protein
MTTGCMPIWASIHAWQRPFSRNSWQRNEPFRAEPIRPGNVYKARFSRQRQRRTVKTMFYAAVAFAVGAVISAAMIAPPSLSLDSWGITLSDEPAQARHFGFCHTGGGTNCVVDGDTIWLDGIKIRVADIDARKHIRRAAHMRLAWATARPSDCMSWSI